MTEFTQALRRFARETAPKAEAVARIASSCDDRIGPPLPPEQLQDATAPDPMAMIRLEAKLANARARRDRPVWMWGVAVMAAAAVLAIGFWPTDSVDAPKMVESEWMGPPLPLNSLASPHPEQSTLEAPKMAELPTKLEHEPLITPQENVDIHPSKPPIVVQSTQLLDVWLDTKEQSKQLVLTEDVELAFQGTGQVSGSPKAPRLNWLEGTLGVEVRPGKGIDLVVQTREAEIRVVGTGFDVVRNDLGTSISVRHGRVKVHCVDGKEALLSTQEMIECLPVSGSGWLARAQALRRNGATSKQVERAIAAGVEKAESGSAVEAELQFVRLQMAVAAGAPSVRRDIEAFLERTPVARVADAHRLAMHLALADRDCESAERHVRGLSAEEQVQVRDEVEVCRQQ